jgi:glycerol dehydrogenase
VLNDGQGAYREVLDLLSPPRLCIVDARALAEAPPRLLAAGLADTLAKWLEWRAVEEAPSGFGAAAGWALAQAAFELCWREGAEALALPGPARERCVEACLLWSGLASNAGQAPAAAAHSLANALSQQGPGKALLHGEAVGLGLLWQEALLGQAGRPALKVSELRQTLASWGLPVSLPAGLDLEALLGAAWEPDESLQLLDLAPPADHGRSALPL